MRYLWFAIMLPFAISCSQKTNDTITDRDSVSAVTTSTQGNTVPAQSETSTPAEPEGPPPTYGDMYYDPGPDLFITTDLDSIVLLLKSRLGIGKDKISFDSYEGEYDSVKVVRFEESELTFDRTIDGNYVFGDFVIKTTGFPFKEGLTIGMPRRDAVAIMGIDSTGIEPYGKEDRYVHDFLTGSGDHVLYHFLFDQKNFIGLTRKYENMD